MSEVRVPYTLAGQPISELKHVLVVGDADAGRPNHIQSLLEQVQRNNSRAVVYEPFGEPHGSSDPAWTPSSTR